MNTLVTFSRLVNRLSLKMLSKGKYLVICAIPLIAIPQPANVWLSHNAISITIN